MHSSSFREILSSCDLPHARLLQVAPAGILVSGSSDSSSGGSGFGVDDGTGCSAAARLVERGFVTGTGTGVGAAETTSSAAGFGGGAGVSSTVECLPVVQGGIARNSSKVRTRGLQHFQPTRAPDVR